MLYNHIVVMLLFCFGCISPVLKIMPKIDNLKLGWIL